MEALFGHYEPGTREIKPLSDRILRSDTLRFR